MSMGRMITRATRIGLLLTLAATAASAANLLTNGTFETGDLTGWTTPGSGPLATITVVADNGPTAPGSHAAFLSNQSGAPLALLLKQSTPAASAAAGPVYYSYDLKLGQAGAGGVFFVEIFAEKAGGGVIGTSGVLGNYTPGTWTNYSGTFTAPAGTDFLTIQLEANTGAVIGSNSSMYADNVSLSQSLATPAHQNTWGQLKNLYR